MKWNNIFTPYFLIPQRKSISWPKRESAAITPPAAPMHRIDTDELLPRYEDGPGWRRRAHSTIQPCSLPTVQTNWLHNSSGYQSKASLNPLRPSREPSFRVFVVFLRSAVPTCCSHAICRQARQLTRGMTCQKMRMIVFKHGSGSFYQTATHKQILQSLMAPTLVLSGLVPTRGPQPTLSALLHYPGTSSTKYHCRSYAPAIGRSTATQRG